MQLPQNINVLEHNSDTAVLRFELQPDTPCFQGHFENLPILAGVVQIAWAISLAEQHFNRRFIFTALRSNKFQQLIRPPMTVTLTLTYNESRGHLRFVYSNSEGTCSSGVIVMREAP